jgi:cyclophilin family peptidyl-prolyl cis-trans isomerase
MIGMSKESGYAGTNECIFYITLGAPLSYMDNKNVIFGRVINGMRTFKMIEKGDIDNEKPVSPIQIKDASLY